MNIRATFIAFYLSVFAGTLQATPSADTHIVRCNTKDFNQRIEKLKYNEEQALKLLRDATARETNAAFSRRSLFIVGNEYMFGIPEKTRISLSGYYVDGDTGRITKRNSKRYLRWYNTKLPKNAFEQEDVIREADSPQH